MEVGFFLEMEFFVNGGFFWKLIFFLEIEGFLIFFFLMSFFFNGFGFFFSVEFFQWVERDRRSSCHKAGWGWGHSGTLPGECPGGEVTSLGRNVQGWNPELETGICQKESWLEREVRRLIWGEPCQVRTGEGRSVLRGGSRAVRRRTIS